jgi:hypothetical protein
MAQTEKVGEWAVFSTEVPLTTKQEVARHRIQICGKCPELRPKVHQCKQCGCIMPLKVRMMGQRCPLGKWGPRKFVERKPT